MPSDVPLFLVDGHNLLYRAWFGFPARIMSRDGQRDLTGVFGFFALLRKAIREVPVAPEVIVVFDGEGSHDERLAIEPAYKAHRPRDEAALAPLASLDAVRDGLDRVDVRQAVVNTAEADDLIATLVARSDHREVAIMSVDRDFYQLVDDRVRVLNTARRPGERLVEAKEIEARYGVRPEQWCDRAALAGDPSDGIAGVRGIGPVWSARLLAGGLHVEDLPSSGRLTGRIGRLVTPMLDQVRVWRDLMRMRVDVTTDLDPVAEPSPPLPLAAQVVERLGLW